LHRPSLPQFGSHHSKGMLCFFNAVNGGGDGGVCGGGGGGGVCDKCGESGCLRPSGAYLAVIITTANYIHSDLKLTTNGVWCKCFPLKHQQSSSSSSSSTSSTSLGDLRRVIKPTSDCCEFEDDLCRYFDIYNKRAHKRIVDIDMIRNYDFSRLRFHFYISLLSSFTHSLTLFFWGGVSIILYTGLYFLFYVEIYI
jgi:hypothetical protein